MEPQQTAILFFDATMTNHGLLLSALDRTLYRVVQSRSDVETMVRLRTGRYAALVIRTGPRGTYLLPLLRRLKETRRTLPLLVLTDTEACTAARMARANGAMVRTLHNLDAFDPRALAEAIEQTVERWHLARLRAASRSIQTTSLLERFSRWMTSLSSQLAMPRAWRW